MILVDKTWGIKYAIAMSRNIIGLAVSSLVLVCFLSISPQVQAQDVLGMHIMNIHELNLVQTFFSQLPEADRDRYLTVPLTLADLEKKDDWQAFFDQADEYDLIPIVRLATVVEDGMWRQPNRHDIVQLVTFLHELDWPTDQKHIIVFNEVNHAKEWGGVIRPDQYNDVLKFTYSWAHALDDDFVVLPAAMDLAANNSAQTREAFSYLGEMHQLDPEIFTYLDAWNSHSYPNPGFSASPTRTGQNSLRGYQHELAFIKDKTGQDLQVYITETGWEVNQYTVRWLESYYTYAFRHIWSDPRVVAVTPFVFKGAPGPFSGFSFVDAQDQPTSQFEAITNAIHKLFGQESTD